MYELGVIIGRFQPFHLGHKAVLDNGLKIAKKILIFIGSHNSPRTMVNPWTTKERELLIRQIYKNECYSPIPRIEFFGIEDCLYNDTLWMKQIQQEVYRHDYTDENIVLLGEKKDQGTSFYLNMFPNWRHIGLKNIQDINATDIRESFFDYRNRKNDVKYQIKNMVPEKTWEFLNRDTYYSDYYNYIKNEFEFQVKHDDMWKSAPYPPKFITVDSVVVQSGHVLLIRRKEHPGKGLLALPGGYLGNERIFDGAIRELHEETKIKVPLDALKGSLIDVQVFDHPKRSTRGHIVTHAHLFKLKDGGKLPRIKGSDDADKAIWVPYANIKRNEMFEDHADIIFTMISRLNGDKRQ